MWWAVVGIPVGAVSLFFTARWIIGLIRKDNAKSIDIAAKDETIRKTKALKDKTDTIRGDGEEAKNHIPDNWDVIDGMRAEGDRKD